MTRPLPSPAAAEGDLLDGVDDICRLLGIQALDSFGAAV